MDATEIARVDRKAPRLQPRPSGGLQCTFNFSSAQVRLECGKTRQWGPEFDKLDFQPSGAKQCGKTVVACRGSPPWLLWPGRAATVDLRPRAALPRLAPPSLRLCSSSPAGPWQVLLPARSSPDNTLSAKKQSHRNPHLELCFQGTCHNPVFSRAFCPYPGWTCETSLHGPTECYRPAETRQEMQLTGVDQTPPDEDTDSIVWSAPQL
ncbi:uncharacterized protein LOC115521488 [Lynx canadensis]|uniref:uncharacterized protein LOC115521488 n=1 Tax=Lynx canadensis TaxID=61383 RepID=UPI0011B00940|nr:uncharacterized protein LOC115521488 [Lynx canadensis]